MISGFVAAAIAKIARDPADPVCASIYAEPRVTAQMDDGKCARRSRKAQLEALPEFTEDRSTDDALASA